MASMLHRPQRVKTCVKSVESLSDLLFNPFELNSDDHYSVMFDVNPGMNYYNELSFHIEVYCDYYSEEFQ